MPNQKMANKAKSDQKLAEKPKIGRGRPSSYRPEYCQKLIDHMRDGYSFESFAAIADVNQDTLYEWAKVHPNFSEAKKKAFAKSLLFWEQAGINGLWPGGETFNTALWIFNMKNRHKWTDRVDVTAREDKPTGLEESSDDELDNL